MMKLPCWVDPITERNLRYSGKMQKYMYRHILCTAYVQKQFFNKGNWYLETMNLRDGGISLNDNRGPERNKKWYFLNWSYQCSPIVTVAYIHFIYLCKKINYLHVGLELQTHFRSSLSFVFCCISTHIVNRNFKYQWQ